MAQPMNPTPEDELLTKLEDSEFVELLVAARCGELAALSCLCSPFIRRAHAVITSRFTGREQAVIFKEICGCAVQQQPTQPTSSTNTTPTVPVSVNLPPPVALPPPAAPPVSCNPALQPAGTFSRGTIS
jgi:hypothetical protein